MKTLINTLILFLLVGCGGASAYHPSEFLLEKETKDVYLLVGQSNANGYMHRAIRKTANEIGYPFVSEMYKQGGNELSNWIDENGVKGQWWQPMTDTFNTSIDDVLIDGFAIRKIHIIFIQGEADVQQPYTQTAVINGGNSIYTDKLANFINELSDQLIDRYGSQMPIVFSVALISYDQNHPTFLSLPQYLSADRVNKIRSDIQYVADNMDNVKTFDTEGYCRRDHVHLCWYGNDHLNDQVSEDDLGDMKTLSDIAMNLF